MRFNNNASRLRQPAVIGSVALSLAHEWQQRSLDVECLEIAHHAVARFSLAQKEEFIKLIRPIFQEVKGG